MDRTEAQDIAAAVNGLRPDWGIPGIMQALEKLQDRDAASVRTAALHAAKNRTDQRSPAVLAFDGEHWNGTKYGRKSHVPSVEPTGPRCDICGRTRTAHDIAESKVSPDQRHDFELWAKRSTTTGSLPRLKAVA